MMLDYTTEGSVKIYMEDYVNKIIDEFPEEVQKVTRTPASEHLFRVDEDGDKLSEEMAEQFHTCVAKCLFLSKRARPDILVAVAFYVPE